MGRIPSASIAPTSWRRRPCDALVALLSNRFDAELLARAPRLRVVANCAAGVDNVTWRRAVPARWW